MSDQDVGFSRIAPNFLDRNSVRFTPSDSDAGLSEARWDAYRTAFASAGVKLGIQRDESGDAFIMVASVGLVNRGHTSGYLYCPPASTPGQYRFYPCVLGKEQGHRDYDSRTRDEAYSFLKLDDHWYAYDEGPS